MERDLRLFVPFTEFKVGHRYGVHRVRFAVAVFADLGAGAPQHLAVAAQPSYILTVALRQWSCPDEILRRAA